MCKLEGYKGFLSIRSKGAAKRPKGRVCKSLTITQEFFHSCLFFPWKVAVEKEMESLKRNNM
jgi:hypothetical protein